MGQYSSRGISKEIPSGMAVGAEDVETLGSRSSPVVVGADVAMGMTTGGLTLTDVVVEVGADEVTVVVVNT